MKTGSSGKATGTAAAAAVCLALLLAGAGLVGVSSPAPLQDAVPTSLLAVLLFAAYVFASRVTLDFEVRGDAHGVTVGQLPLALGAIVVAPGLHLAACLLAAVVNAVIRRQHLLKAGYNIGAAGFEVGAVTALVSLTATSGRPSAGLWAGVYAGLLVGDMLGSLALSAVWRLLGMPVDRGQAVQPLLLGVATSTVATATALVSVSAAYTEPASVVVVLLLVAALAVAYRRHRQLAAQQASTQELYAFVRDLGPVDADADAAQDVLEQVRLLLHAQRLELVVPSSDGSWQQLVAAEGQPPQRTAVASPSACPRQDDGRHDVLTSSLIGSQGLLGVLTARGRLGQVRGFDLGDLRLLETVGAELGTALERGRLLADLRRTATTDALTGLPNLAETTRLIDQLLHEDEQWLVVAAVSVDSFRDVNDTLGHAVGDDLLLETARRLRAAHPDAVLGRIGGARFALALRADRTPEVAMMIGLGIRALAEGEARIGPVTTHIRLSVGVVVAPEHGRDGRTLLRRAETAMSTARTDHGGPVSWTPVHEAQGQRRLAVLAALRDAVVNGGIGLAFQPKLDVRTGAVTGMEALARWTHPGLGAVSPEEFVPLAEASGFIGPLTTTVLRQAAATCKNWQRRAPGVGVAVNVSASTVLDPQFCVDLTAILTGAGLAPELLTLEITEGVLVSDAALAVERLTELRGRGVRIAVDDFGTGYSSLTYLKGLPVDEVKIDKTFVAGMLTEPADQAVVRAVVDIAHTLDLQVVAEGIELQEQQRALAALGVDQAQGYLHGRPMPESAAASWLRSRVVRLDR